MSRHRSSVLSTDCQTETVGELRLPDEGRDNSAPIETTIVQLRSEVHALRDEVRTLVEAIGQSGDRPSPQLDRTLLTELVSEVVDAVLRAKEIDEALGAEPELPLRRQSIDEMLAPHVLDETAVEGLLSQTAGMMDASAFAAHLSMTSQNLHKLRSQGKVIGLAQATRKVWFPVAQVGDNRRILPGIREVLEVCGGDSWAAHRFLAGRSAALGGLSGYAALQRGRTSGVLTTLRAMREGAID